MVKSFDEFAKPFLDGVDALSSNEPMTQMLYELKKKYTKDFLKILKAYHEEFCK